MLDKSLNYLIPNKVKDLTRLGNNRDAGYVVPISSLKNCNFMIGNSSSGIIEAASYKKGVINIGGKTQSVYNFAKKYNSKIKRTSGKKIFPPNPWMNLTKLKKILKKSKNSFPSNPTMKTGRFKRF